MEQIDTLPQKLKYYSASRAPRACEVLMYEAATEIEALEKGFDFAHAEVERLTLQIDTMRSVLKAIKDATDSGALYESAAIHNTAGGALRMLDRVTDSAESEHG